MTKKYVYIYKVPKIKRGNVDKMYMNKYDEWHHSNDKIIWE